MICVFVYKYIYTRYDTVLVFIRATNMYLVKIYLPKSLCKNFLYSLIGLNNLSFLNKNHVLTYFINKKNSNFE